jgi:uncharacterized membrane protein
MKIEKETPPNYEAICLRFPTVGDNVSVVFTYGDTLYAPHIEKVSDIPDHIIAHEVTHTNQQGDNPDGWWTQYMEDDAFRLSQELEAYRAQYSYAKARYGTKNADKLRTYLAIDLCSDIYELDITFGEAERLIKANQ